MSISISSSTPVQAPQKTNPLEATDAKRGDKPTLPPAEDSTSKPASTAQAFTNALGQLTGTNLSVKA